MFLLIQFLKIMPKIIFRGDILPKFKHLLTQWKKSQSTIVPSGDTYNGDVFPNET